MNAYYKNMHVSRARVPDIIKRSELSSTSFANEVGKTKLQISMFSTFRKKFYEMCPF